MYVWKSDVKINIIIIMRNLIWPEDNCTIEIKYSRIKGKFWFPGGHPNSWINASKISWITRNKSAEFRVGLSRAKSDTYWAQSVRGTVLKCAETSKDINILQIYVLNVVQSLRDLNGSWHKILNFPLKMNQVKFVEYSP